MYIEAWACLSQNIQYLKLILKTKCKHKLGLLNICSYVLRNKKIVFNYVC